MQSKDGERAGENFLGAFENKTAPGLPKVAKLANIGVEQRHVGGIEIGEISRRRTNFSRPTGIHSVQITNQLLLHLIVLLFGS